MTKNTKNRVALWMAGAFVALSASVANAGTVSCPTTLVDGVYAFTVTTTPTSSCHDYGVPNIPPDTVSVGIGTPTPGNDVLELPAGYQLLSGTINVPNAPTLPGVLEINQATGEFKIWAASASPFILYLKQGNQWVTFLLGASSGTFTTASSSGVVGTGLSNWAVFGGGDSYQVPLPAAAWLMLSGLLGLIGVGRRRAASAA